MESLQDGAAERWQLHSAFLRVVELARKAPSNKAAISACRRRTVSWGKSAKDLKKQCPVPALPQGSLEILRIPEALGGEPPLTAGSDYP